MTPDDSSATLSRDFLHRLPKAELHVHLDGSPRAETLIELAREQGRLDVLPATEPEALRRVMAADAGDLESYLERFHAVLALLQEAEALERVAYELAEDLAAENVRYAEIRFSPVLSAERGLSPEEALGAALRGLARAERDHAIRTAFIVCGIRNMDPATSLALAELTVAYRDRGVVAFDLAGAEYNYPAKKHREAFYTVINRNMATTIHAGEAYGSESIHQALHYCRANRIGHGTRLHEDESLLGYVRDFRIPLEMCLTSNVQTGAVASCDAHPMRSYFDRDLVVTLNTDNRLISGTTLTDEYWKAHRHLGFDRAELVRLARGAFEAAFLPWHEKRAALDAFDREVLELTA